MDSLLTTVSIARERATRPLNMAFSSQSVLRPRIVLLQCRWASSPFGPGLQCGGSMPGVTNLQQVGTGRV
jgi:hypothetical protein